MTPDNQNEASEQSIREFIIDNFMDFVISRISNTGTMTYEQFELLANEFKYK